MIHKNTKQPKNTHLMNLMWWSQKKEAPSFKCKPFLQDINDGMLVSFNLVKCSTLWTPSVVLILSQQSAGFLPTIVFTNWQIIFSETSTEVQTWKPFEDVSPIWNKNDFPASHVSELGDRYPSYKMCLRTPGKTNSSHLTGGLLKRKLISQTPVFQVPY